ncbi:alpha/beta hydrolase [Methylicorpusculum oleiharenae]|uniref:alpha/beta hydrolase n=1 Tax=Methylicorpusculum oleiharenae TaxID=1338687 RepID=UPI001356C605|nr:YqiA/YcfP family alpha/beta fold hydrolase [Methylicorpusculum oleiharenae]MCD2448962.1 alpha/beta hydrolase [Methylicorpusculum oleiharenae]
MKKKVIYSHGKDSMPWGEKTRAFADVAKRHGYVVESPDYRAQPDPDERVKHLLATDWQEYNSVVLVGSSMGGYISTVASPVIKPKGLFLLAPAFYLPGYQITGFAPVAEAIAVFHGWQDDIVPPEHVWRFCQAYRLRLNLYDADHRLMSVLPELTAEFDRFLAGLS